MADDVDAVRAKYPTAWVRHFPVGPDGTSGPPGVPGRWVILSSADLRSKTLGSGPCVPSAWRNAAENVAIRGAARHGKNGPPRGRSAGRQEPE